MRARSGIVTLSFTFCRMRCVLVFKAWAARDATLSANRLSPAGCGGNSSARQDLEGGGKKKRREGKKKLVLLGCHGDAMWVPPPVLAVSSYLSLPPRSMGRLQCSGDGSKGCWDTSSRGPSSSIGSQGHSISVHVRACVCDETVMCLYSQLCHKLTT